MSDKPFRITKVLDGAQWVWDVPGNKWDIDPTYELGSGNNWEVLGASLFLSRETLDIAGLSVEERTLFFGTQTLQKSIAYTTSITASPAGGGSLSDTIVVSDVPLGDADGATPLSILAGFNMSPDNYENTILGNGTVYVQSTNAPLTMMQSDAWNFGSGDPTATNQLYLYRWVNIISGFGVANAGNLISVPDVRYVATGMSTQEPDLVYINRLRLSYEQSKTVL